MRRLVSFFVITFFLLFIIIGSSPVNSNRQTTQTYTISRDSLEVTQQANGYSHYTSYSELESKLQQLSAKYDRIMKLYNNRGSSYEGRTLWVVKISDNPGSLEDDEPELLFLGAHHGNELIGNEMAIYIIETLTKNYDTDPRISWLVNHHQIWIVPMPNPDGTEYTMNVESWRKNRSPNYISETTPGPFDPKVYPTSYGVDLNRNYDIEWGDPGGSTRLVQQSGTYSGPEPFSETETRAIRDLVLEHNFTFYMDYHSGIELILYPWGYTSDPTPDNALFEGVAQKLSELTGYEARQGYDLYQTNGDAVDWVYYATRTLSFTVELSREYAPDKDRVDEVIKNNIKQPLFLMGISSDPELGVDIDIIHNNIGNQTDKGPYPVTAMVAGLHELSGLEVRLYYKINNGDYTKIKMAFSKENTNQYYAEIPTQAPHSKIKYFVTVESEDLMVTSPPGPYINEFEIKPLPESITTNTELAAMIIMMIIIMGFFWGGFGYASFIAMRAEQRKLHEYYYGD